MGAAATEATDRPRSHSWLVMERQMQAEWRRLGASRRYRSALRRWGSEAPALEGFDNGLDLVAFTHLGNQEPNCEILDALILLADTDELALRTIYQILLPRLVYLVMKGSPIDHEERFAVALAVVREMVKVCQPGTAGTPTDYRLWCNIRRKYLRQLKALCRGGDDDTAGDHLFLTELELEQHVETTTEMPLSEDYELATLTDWVARTARTDMDTARFMVLTRAGGVPVETVLGTSEPLACRKLRRRRLRAEQRLREAVTG